MGGPSGSRGLHPLPTCQNEGYSARPYPSKQTPIMVNTRLPKEILANPAAKPPKLDQWTFLRAGIKPPVCFRKRAVLSPSGPLGHYA